MRLALAILVLAGSAPLSAQATDPLAFLRHRGEASDAQLEAYSAPPYHPVRVGELRTAAFLTEGGATAFGQMLGPVNPPTVRSTQSAQAVLPGAVIAVIPPQGATYHHGDTVVVAVVSQGPSNWGSIVTPTGLARISDQVGRQTLATVISMFGPIRVGQVVFPLQPASDPGAVTPVAASGPSGDIIAGATPRELQQSGGEMFISIGRSAGVRIGDFIQVRRKPTSHENAADTIGDLMAVGQVVHTGERTATIRLTRVIDPAIRPGTPVVRVLTLPG